MQIHCLDMQRTPVETTLLHCSLAITPVLSSEPANSARTAAPCIAAQAGHPGEASMQTHSASGLPKLLGAATPYAKRWCSWVVRR